MRFIKSSYLSQAKNCLLFEMLVRHTKPLRLLRLSKNFSILKHTGAGLPFGRPLPDVQNNNHCATLCRPCSFLNSFRDENNLEN
ncbi:hypothetical protein EG349_08770 [Chryseobacterium shandongense]|uniref:Uncharacterized protein n=1 Tax=Chryseobacterium shandongense TaxID=1493872 RepID=A0AAD0YG14_9FLAO|nr:hypothetical protein EG349_08770 [Chryseobacterium shandongense]AZA95289.1 hypothetical protein EG353_06820 [Chryseobacterium shandongense]